MTEKIYYLIIIEGNKIFQNEHFKELLHILLNTIY